MSDTFLKYVPLNRIAKLRDIANAVSFFLNDEASFITGEFPVAGGFGLPTPIYGDFQGMTKSQTK